MMTTRSNMLTAGISNNKVKYSRLAADDDGYIDLQVRDFVDWWQNVTKTFLHHQQWFVMNR